MSVDRRGEVEACLDRHPDAPPEVVLKCDLLTLGHWFSDRALALTAGSIVKSYRLFSYDLVPMDRLTRREGRRVPEFFTVFGGPWGLRPVNVQTSLAPDSPYLVDVVDGRLCLTTAGQVLAEVRFPRAPRYYDLSLPDGTPYHEIVAFGFFITAFRACQFASEDEECKFCDINRNVRQMSRSGDFVFNAAIKPVADVAAVVDAIADEHRRVDGEGTRLSLLITGGTIKSRLDGRDEETFYGDYVEAVKGGDPDRHVSLQTNAQPPEVLERLRARGLDSHHANMEVWDPRLFSWLVPGKEARVGRERWIRWLAESVPLFEPGEVKPLFVCGIEMARPHGFTSVDEAVASTTEGIDHLMSRGVVPRFNHWRREPGSRICQIADQPPVPLDFHVRLMGNRYALWKQYGLPLPNQGRLLKPTRHLGVAHGTYEDWILLREDTYPPDILAVIDRRSVPWTADPPIGDAPDAAG